MKSPAWQEELKRYEAYLRHMGRTKHYIASSIPYLRALGERFGKPYLDLSKDEIVGWFGELAETGLRGKGLAPPSLRSVFGRVRACMRYLSDGVTPPSLRGLSPGKPKSRVGSADELPTAEELEQLAGALNAKWRAALFLTRYSGARPSECLGILRKDARLKEHDGIEYAELTFRDTKTGDTRNVPVLKPEAVAALKLWLDLGPRGEYLFPGQKRGEKPGTHLGHQAFWRALKRAGEEAKLEKKITPYILRHARANELYDKPPAIRDQAMGWKSGLMWKNYTHLRTVDVRDSLWEETEGGPEIIKRDVSRLEKMIALLAGRWILLEHVLMEVLEGRPPAAEQRQRLDSGGDQVWGALRELMGEDDAKLAGGE